MAHDALATLDDRLKQVIQTLYTIQVCAHGYAGPETQQELIRQISALGPQVNATTQFAPGSLPSVPPEIIQYIDSGRNPDIYTREFVELVLRQNAYIKGKADAFADFRDVLAEEIVRGMGTGMKPFVDRATGADPAGANAKKEKPGEEGKRQESSANGA